MTYDSFNDPFMSAAVASSVHFNSELGEDPHVCVHGDDHKEVALSALKKADHSVEHEIDPVSGDACAVPDALGYDADVTAESVLFLRDKAGDFLSKKKWKVIDGYAGSTASRVG